MCRPSIHTLSAESLGYGLILGSPANAAYPASNDAIFIPVTLYRPALVTRLFVANGNVTSGSMDMGIYTLDGSRIVSFGVMTTQTGTQVLQFFNITDTYLSPGKYYMAIVINNGTATLRRYNVSIIREQMYGVLKATSAAPLPASVTFATMTAAYIPSMGMELMGVL
jgi:hypothetical protein